MDLYEAIKYYQLPKTLPKYFYYDGEAYIGYIDPNGMDVEFSPLIDDFFVHTDEKGEAYLFVVENPLNYADYHEDEVLIVKEGDGELIFWDGKYSEKEAAILFYDKKEKILFVYNMKTGVFNKRRCN